MTCSTCKHWRPGLPTSFPVFDSNMDLTSHGECERIKWSESIDVDYVGREPAVVVSGDRPSALNTLPTFVCGLHEERDGVAIDLESLTPPTWRDPGPAPQKVFDMATLGTPPHAPSGIPSWVYGPSDAMSPKQKLFPPTSHLARPQYSVEEPLPTDTPQVSSEVFRNRARELRAGAQPEGYIDALEAFGLWGECQAWSAENGSLRLEDVLAIAERRGLSPVDLDIIRRGWRL